MEKSNKTVAENICRLMLYWNEKNSQKLRCIKFDGSDGTLPMALQETKAPVKRILVLSGNARINAKEVFDIWVLSAQTSPSAALPPFPAAAL
jgi:hypothetical protein